MELKIKTDFYKIFETRLARKANVTLHWINEPFIVLVGYLLLGLLSTTGEVFLFRAVLSVALALFGTGYSLFSVIYPQRKSIDFLERMCLGAYFSVTISGLLSFYLARSPWGLNLSSFLFAIVLINLICYVLVLYRQRNQENNEFLEEVWHRPLSKGAQWLKMQSTGNIVLTSVIILVFLAGVFKFSVNILAPSSDPPMTEFFLLDQAGHVNAFPEKIPMGGSVTIQGGITNRENQIGKYSISVEIDGKTISYSKPIQLESGETRTELIPITLPDNSVAKSGDAQKVEFVLYKNDQPYRNLFLWFTVE